MIDAAVAFEPAGDVVALDLWAGELPATDLRTLRVEPRRWWLIGAGDRVPDLGNDGAATPIGAGLVRATLTGSGWRGLLMLAGCFDAENRDFGPSQLAATIIHHVPVWIAPTADDTCEVYLPASYANALARLWEPA